MVVNQIELYPHQRKAVDELHTGSVLRGGVGTGKSRTALAYFYEKELGGDVSSLAGRHLSKDARRELEAQPIPYSDPPPDTKDLYIITTAKKRDSADWDLEALAFGITTDRSISPTGVRLTVDSWNNIANYVDVRDAFFIFDEQRLVGSGSWVKAFNSIAKANNWILLSATPGDTWMDYIPVFVANGWYKNRTEFVRNHVVFSRYSKFPKVEKFIGTKKLNLLRDKVLVEMPYERHTVRHIHDEYVDYDEFLFEKVWKDRWHVYEERPLRDIAEMFSVARKVVNSDFSRIESLLRTFDSRSRIILFYNFNYELEMLRTATEALAKHLSPDEFSVAEWNGHKHEEVPTTSSWIYLVQYVAGAEGWNCITTDTVLKFSLNYSWKVNEQTMGRIDRLNTPYTDLHYYQLQSHSPIDKAIRKSLNAKQSFNEKELVKEMHLEW